MTSSVKILWMARTVKYHNLWSPWSNVSFNTIWYSASQQHLETKQNVKAFLLNTLFWELQKALETG